MAGLLRSATAVFLVGLLLAGCTHADTGRTASGSPSSPTNSPPSATSAVSRLPDTPAGRQLRWVMQAVAAPSGPTVTAVDQHMSAQFLAAVPADKVIALFAQQRATRPVQLQTFIATMPSAGQASVTQPGGQRLLISRSTDAAGQIDGLQVKPAPPLPSVTSPAELQRAAAGLGVWSAVLLAHVEGGTCTVEQALDDQGPHPLGSMFKLYVLGAVARAVQAGKLSWDTRLTVTQAVKSLPTGRLQDAPDGTKVTVQQAATLMISISDNTAADLLIGAVG